VSELPEETTTATAPVDEIPGDSPDDSSTTSTTTTTTAPTPSPATCSMKVEIDAHSGDVDNNSPFWLQVSCISNGLWSHPVGDCLPLLAETSIMYHRDEQWLPPLVGPEFARPFRRGSSSQWRLASMRSCEPMPDHQHFLQRATITANHAQPRQVYKLTVSANQRGQLELQIRCKHRGWAWLRCDNVPKSLVPADST
jgi:hypothetical protein